MKIHFLKPLAGICLLLLTISCKVEPEAIEYGKDQCSFCVMNIVDKTHAAQYVTKKGTAALFGEIAKQEKDIRTNVSSRTSDILRKVFNYADAQKTSYLK